MKDSLKKYDLSIVIPLFNEEGNIFKVTQEIIKSLEPISCRYEIVLIDDGSADKTLWEAKRVAERYTAIKVISLSNNLGQGFAIRKGLESSGGQYICFLDGDRQFDPCDILRLFKKFNEYNLDFICGRRQDRKDSLFFNHLPSRVGNAFIRWIFKTTFQDIGCALKIGRRSHLLAILPFENYHRYINILLVILNPNIKYQEIKVSHLPRITGKTKYGPFKFFKVFFEVLWIKFFYLPKKLKS